MEANDKRARGRLVAGVLATVSIVAACTSGGDDKSSEPPSPSISGRVASGSATLSPLPVASTPKWSVTPGDVADVSDVTVAGSTVVVTGTATDNTVAPMTALDAATGAARWTVDDLGDFTGGGWASWTEHAPFAAPGSSPLLLTDYYVPHCTTTAHTCPAGSTDSGNPEHGVVALSPTDGHVVWQNALIPSVADGSEHSRDWQGATVGVVAVANGLAVVTIELNAGSSGAQYDDTRTVALDAATGMVRWSTPGFQALAATGDHITGLTGTPHLILSTVGALDLSTGAKRWSLSGPLAGAAFLADSGPAVAVRRVGGSTDITVLRATDGRAVGTYRATIGCDGGDELLACITGITEQRLVTYAAGEPSPATSIKAIGSIEAVSRIVAVHDGYTIVASSAGVLSYDRAGNTTGPPLPDDTRYVDNTAVLAYAANRVALYSVG